MSLNKGLWKGIQQFNVKGMQEEVSRCTFLGHLFLKSKHVPDLLTFFLREHCLGC